MALPNPKVPRAGSYRFFAGMGILAAAYGLLIVGMLIADLGFTDWRQRILKLIAKHLKPEEK
ncbi:MAG: hypothetical protein HQ519_00810 [Planctomycetes bacterium]|nr:hypothetical protein [Planctomycetota bacterium]